MVNFGLGMPNLAESGVRMTCKCKIAGASAKTFILQVRGAIQTLTKRNINHVRNTVTK